MPRTVVLHLAHLLGLSAPGCAALQPRQSTVLSIGDGDTLRVRRHGTTVTVRLLVKSTERYGRLVAEVIGAFNVGLAMVEDGQAFVYRRHLNQCDTQEYLAAESRARRRGRGASPADGHGGGSSRAAPGGIPCRSAIRPERPRSPASCPVDA